MKRNQIAVIAQIKKTLNSFVHTKSEVTALLDTYCAECGLKYNIDNSQNSILHDVLRIEFIDTFSDDVREIECYYIDENVTFNDFGFSSNKYNGSDKTRDNQHKQTQAWHIEQPNGNELLVSYNTIVAFYYKRHNKIYFTPMAFKHSTTTCRHISAWLAEFGAVQRGFARIGG